MWEPHIIERPLRGGLSVSGVDIRPCQQIQIALNSNWQARLSEMKKPRTLPLQCAAQLGQYLILQSPHWLIRIRCFFAWPICAQFSLARVCALGLTISHAFKLEPSSRQQLISVPLSEGNRCIRLRSRLPAHCVRFGMRTGWACCVALASRSDPAPAKRHDHNTASSIWAMSCPVCHSLNARLTIVNASTCPLAVRSCVGSA
jgi:hypothetical protein